MYSGTDELIVTSAGEGAEASPSPKSPSQTLARLTLLLIGVALFAGVAELVVAFVRKALFEDVLRVSRDIVWMVPLGQLMLLVPAAVLPALAQLVLPRLRRTRLVPMAVMSTALISILLFTTVLHDVAVVLLAGGIAWRLSGAVHDRPRVVDRLLGFTIPGLVLLFVLLGTGMRAGLLVRERATLAGLPTAIAGAPNVILIIWDTVRAASLSLYGHSRSTSPNLDRLASRGTVFEMALSTSSWTLPAHVSLFTGRLPAETTANWDQPFVEDHTTLAEALAERGYATAAFAANPLYVQWEQGIDRGFARFEDYRVTPGQVFLSTALGRRLATGRHGWGTPVLFRLADYTELLGRKRADHVNRDFLDWSGAVAGRPYFAFLNYYDAHLPYLPPRQFAGVLGAPRASTSFSERVRREIEGFDYWNMDQEAITAEQAAYEESIMYLDDRLRLLIEALEERGDMTNTLLIIASDHGEEFGEHGVFEHGKNLYMLQTHVPLVLIHPERVPAGRRVPQPVSIRDIPATVLDLVGADPAPLAGSTLRAFWDGGEVPPAGVVSQVTVGLSADEVMCSVMDNEFHLIRNLDESTEVYDWVADPGQRVNLTSQVALRGGTDRLEQLLATSTSCGTPRR